MSDSILYLAIVAIWAGFLIPAWVRRPHTSKTEPEPAEFEAEFEPEATAGPQSAFLAAPIMDEVDHLEVTDSDSEYRDDVHMHSYGQPEPQPAARPAPGPSQSREQMMRARRRMLTILAGLTFVTALFVLMGLVQWWICVPPIAMLVLYVLLLREIAMADAELARKRHAWEAGQAQARDTWRRSYQAAQAAAAAEAAEPVAEIIDISRRVGDQLYDQYADAAVRAVGD